jgi:hypothetical protein
LGKGIKLRFMLGGTYYLTSGKIGGLVGREGRRDVIFHAVCAHVYLFH